MASRILVDAEEMELIEERLLAEILERHPRPENLIVVGIQRRGADLAKRLSRKMEKRIGSKIRQANLDINFYRDDWTLRTGAMPHIGATSMPFNIDDQDIVLIDDVLYTGRTARAALEALLDYGRPARVELLALIDRGHRELPIAADYVGRKITTEKDQRVDVFFSARDGRDAVYLQDGSE